MDSQEATERLRTLLRYRGCSDYPYSIDPRKWPELWGHTYRGHRPLTTELFQRRRAEAESAWACTPWLAPLREGYDLLRDSREIWEVDYGPTVSYADPERGLLFVTTGDVEVQKPIDARLPRLARTARIEHDFMRILDLGDIWPHVLVGDRLAEFTGLRQVSRDYFKFCLDSYEKEFRVFPEMASGREPEMKRLRVLLDARDPVYDVAYRRAPHSGYQAQFWLAPEDGIAFLDWACSHGGPAVDAARYREVLPFGSRSSELRAEYARIEREAAVVEDRKHLEKLLEENPTLAPALELLRCGGLPCRKCAQPITAVRAVHVDRQGRASAECRTCGARTTVSV